ncbi:AAA family ATPase [Alienimonas sp. DA493]|uniref:AAA family ATPase n=1 Tax=Alienimonas sp. DA493 TaxID=3373605 RepID=UPI0037542B40
MQITDIEIARYGVWRDLTLPLAGPGLNLLYGPNEAGKTTLMRFIRGVLYGYEPFSTHGFRQRNAARGAGRDVESTEGWDGTIHAEIDGAPHVLRRFREPGGDPRGRLTVTDPFGEVHGEEWLHERLGGLSEAMYRNVYALGIYELQELATLEHADVAAHVHGVSLGPAGRRFLAAADAAEETAAGLLTLDARDAPVGGRIAELMRRRDRLDAQLAALPDGRAAAEELRADLARLDRTFSRLERKKKRLRRELRGARYVGKVHGPWRQVRDLRSELEKLGGSAEVPADGLTRLIAAEANRDAAAKRAAEARHRADEARKHAEAVRFDESLVEHAGAIRALAPLTEWAEEAIRRRDAASEAAANFARRADRADEALDADAGFDPEEMTDEQLEAFVARFAAGNDAGSERFARLAAAAGADPNLAFDSHEDRVRAVVFSDEEDDDERPEPADFDLTRSPNGVDVSPEAEELLTEAAAAYRAAGLKNRRLKRAYKRKDRLFRKREARRSELLASVGVDDPAQALAAADERAAQLSRLCDLIREENVLSGGRTAGGLRPDEWAARLEVPPWVGLCFGVFMFGGAAFGLLGLIQGLTVGWLSGLIFLLIGMCCSGLAWRMRDHMETVLTDAAAEAEARVRASEGDLVRTREEIRTLLITAELEPAKFRARKAGPGEGEWSHKAAAAALLTVERRRASLEKVAETADAHAKQRRALSSLRDRIRRSQGDLTAGRQMWYEALQTVGLPEGVKTAEALEAWREEHREALKLAADAAGRLRGGGATRVVEKRIAVPVPVPTAAGGPGAGEATAVRDAAAQAAARQDDLTAALAALSARVTDLGRTLKRPVEGSAIKVLAGWAKELDGLQDRREERDRRVAEADRLKAEAEELAAAEKTHHAEAHALLTAAGVADRAAYERLAGGSAKRQEVAALLEMAEADLAAAAEESSEFAVQEEDLAQFDPAENRTAVEKLEADLEEIETELRSAQERRGGVARELEGLSADDARDAVRLELSAVNRELKDATERWNAAKLAGRAFASMRADVERTRQPAVLAAAGRYLEQLTGGRYRRVWSPLGERTLMVEDRHGAALAPDALSGGTREQLYLAVRLGLMDHVAEADQTATGAEIDGNGLDLRPPVVLDDVLVNFDQLRTEAALDTLRTFCAEERSADGSVRPARQVLFFTCHLHLAHLFEQGGVDPVWLPRNDAADRFEPVPQVLEPRARVLKAA